MVDLPGNPYEHTATDQESPAHAMLALAYEQRTANMIAFYNDEDLTRGTDSKVVRKLSSDIRKRMMLTTPTTD
ncbi:hypothetical protein ACTXM3_09185 [Glutamicibacter arilaitensis]|uniref:hypothetical protein n=1 Tax=Glutamicibacter arilaitensis TaxID=256701 RepID=UPI003FD2003E